MIPTKKIDEEKCLAEWQGLIKQFHTIIDNEPPPEKVKDKLLELKTKATNNPNLTGRQTEALISRCNNYIEGVWGKSKTAENLKQK